MHSKLTPQHGLSGGSRCPCEWLLLIIATSIVPVASEECQFLLHL